MSVAGRAGAVDVGWLVVAGAGALIVGGSLALARRPAISSREARAFAAVNRLPDVLYRPLWLPMQLGNLWVGGATGVALALGFGDRVAVAGVLAVMALKVPTEHLVERALGRYGTVRQRPGTSVPGAIRRGDVPAAGTSFPSGHIVLISGVTAALGPVVPLPCLLLLGLGTLLVMLGRVYVGAHNPLDVVAGLGAGLVVGGIIATVAG